MAKFNEKEVVRAVKRYRQEADIAKHDRMQQNQVNFDVYHLKQDYSHKNKGQSQEFLPKQSMAVEQAATLLQQGLVDLGEWWKVEEAKGLNPDNMVVKPSEMYSLTNAHLEHNDFMSQVGNMLKLGLLGSVAIVKVHMEYCSKPKFVSRVEMTNGRYQKVLVKEENKVARLKLDLIRQEDYYPDPTGGKLYEMQDSYIDYYELERLSKGENAIYDRQAVERVAKTFNAQSAEDRHRKARETNQNATYDGHRNRVKLTEVWGNILDENGKLLYENVVCTIANDMHVIRKPTPNPYWHQESPFICVPLIQVPHSVWGRALMDAPTYLNKASNEMFNLTLDGGLMAVHGIKQVREDWLEDPTQVEDGIAPGDTLRASATCPPGQKVMEMIATSSIPTDGLNVMNLLNQEFNAAAMTSDLRMGITPFRQQKATAVVEASQTITSMFSGIAKIIEDKLIEKILQKSWYVIAQHFNDLDEDELKGLVGMTRYDQLSRLAPEDIFAETVQGCKFKVFGISRNLEKQQDFTKLTAFLQTLGSSEIFIESFIQKYDFGKLLEEIARSLDIDTERLQPDPEESSGLAGMMAGAPQGADVQSQVPQAGALGNQADLTAEGQLAGNLPTTQFPGSRAVPGGNQGNQGGQNA